ncbi:MAG: hypothetical protein AAGG38_14535 [Planctomycetota bacterium]
MTVAQLFLSETVTPQNFSELMQAMPAVWTVLLAIGLGVGGVLWLFGGRLAKKGVMLTGFVVGGLGAAAVAAGMATGGGGGEGATAESGGGGLWVLAIGIGGAIAGVLLAGLLFRFWMAGSAAVLLGAAVPLVAMVWTGNTPPLPAIESTQDVAEAALGFGESDPAAAALRERVEREYWGQGPLGVPAPGPDGGGLSPEPAEADGASAVFDREQFVDGLRGVWQQQVQEVRTWWAEMAAGSRRFLLGGAVVGAGVGLILGLVLPTLAASLQTALVGSVLILFAGRGLLLSYAPGVDGVLPDTWRGVLLSVGLITLLGVLIQWRMRQKKDDE